MAQLMTYEQLFICRLDNLQISNVSIVLTKLAMSNTYPTHAIDNALSIIDSQLSIPQFG